jgi:NAD(P)H dehydrogenase (quinone)
MRVLVIVDHPRPSSLTHAVAGALAKGLSEAGHSHEILDLYASGFDPRMIPEDEPDWDDAAKRYSPTVQIEIARLRRADALAFVFPVWWWGLPAMTKGYIDRCFARGFAYGGATLPHHRALWLGLAAADAATFDKRGYRDALKVQLDIGIADYCGVKESRVELLHGSLDGGDAAQALIARARAIGLAWPA